MQFLSTILGVSIKVLIAILVVLREIFLAAMRAMATGLQILMTEAPKVAKQVKEGSSEVELPTGVNKFIDATKAKITDLNSWAESHKTAKAESTNDQLTLEEAV